MDHSAAPQQKLPLAMLDMQAQGQEWLHHCAGICHAQGLRLAGFVQQDVQTPGRDKHDMFLIDLVSGARLCLTQDLGPGSEGCRLDYSVLGEAVSFAEIAVSAGLDVLFVNKFGKEEAAGRGFMPVIAECLSRDIAVLIGPSSVKPEEFAAIMGIEKAEILMSADQVLSWLQPRLSASHAA